MKIGILTFHWATNYGAILQCFALQEYLKTIGFDVKIIDYKPVRYEDTLRNFLCDKKFLNITEYFKIRKKEKALIKFRDKHLSLTERVVSCNDISLVANQFDIIISGSDQVANPYFLMSGEGSGVISPTYFLGFQFLGKRIGYALSFGCVSYPENLLEIAATFIRNFDLISVRESSGLNIVSSMGRDDAYLVPDPTLLINSIFYHNLADECQSNLPNTYIYNFFIRNISERKKTIGKLFDGKFLIWNNDDNDYTLEGWLNKIKHADFVITDSFHCVVMCLKLHIRFVVITELNGNIGMNDRFYTLLNYLGLGEYIMNKNDIKIDQFFSSAIIDWTTIDNKIEEYVLSGKNFLKAIS